MQTIFLWIPFPLLALDNVGAISTLGFPGVSSGYRSKYCASFNCPTEPVLFESAIKVASLANASSRVRVTSAHFWSEVTDIVFIPQNAAATAAPPDKGPKMAAVSPTLPTFLRKKSHTDEFNS